MSIGRFEFFKAMKEPSPKQSRTIRVSMLASQIGTRTVKSENLPVQ